MSEQFQNIEYKLPKLGIFKWVLYLGVTFLLALVLYFPFTNTIENQVKSALSSIPGCSISISELDFSLLPPKITIPRTNVPRQCFGQYGKDLVISNTLLNFRGFTFSPFGPHFKLEASVLENNLTALITTGLSEIKVNIQDNVIKLKTLREEFKKVKLDGKIKLNSTVLLKDGELSDLRLTADSSDFGLAAQNISGFKLDALRMKTLTIVAQMKGKKIDLKNFVIGDQASPIRANFKGNLKPNNRNFNKSLVNIKGELAFSKEFSTKYSLIGMLMGKFDKKDNFYQIEIKGPLSAPLIQSPRK